MKKIGNITKISNKSRHTIPINVKVTIELKLGALLMLEMLSNPARNEKRILEPSATKKNAINAIRIPGWLLRKFLKLLRNPSGF